MSKIIVFFVSLFFFIALYVVIIFEFSYKQGLFQFSELWIGDVYKVKDYINSQATDKQRLLVFGGSSSLFGFHGDYITKNTKYSFINYGSHAGLPLNYHIDRMISSVQEGDIVFFPLEFDYYSRNMPKDDYWYIHNMLAWDREYKKYITYMQIFKSYLQNSPIAFLKMFLKGTYTKSTKNENIVDNMQRIWGQDYQEFDFTYKSLSAYGDFCTQVGNIQNYEALLINKYVIKDVSDFFISEYIRLMEFAKAKNVKVFLIYPPTTQRQSLHIAKNLPKLIQQLDDYNIKIYGNFSDVHFEHKYFFDTDYHLNHEGTILRSSVFVNMLLRMEEEGLL